ncbi:MAG: efflux RND transporter periplasmic adaptor subunit [Lysobacteraceae bacterium]
MRLRRSPVLPALACTFVLAACGGKSAEGQGAPGGPPGGGEMQLPVEAVTVTPQPLSAGLQTVGSLRADETVSVRAELPGRITRIHFEEGGHVVAGQPLFTLDASVPEAALKEAQANLENSRRAAARAKELLAGKLVAQADYDKARATLGVDEARVNSARATLEKYTIRAPFSGQVGLRNVSVGAFLTAGQELITLVRVDPIEVDFSVPERALTRLSRGQAIRIEVDAFPGDRFGGRVLAIDPSIDANTRSVKLRAQIGNPDGRLRPGQFARLQLESAGDAQALLVPEQALMQQGDTRFVYTVVGGKAKKTVIKTGLRVPGKVEVVEGLQPGAVVITAGQAKPMMHDGMGVTVLPADGAAPNPAAPNPAAGAPPAAAKPAAKPDPAAPEAAPAPAAKQGG